MLPVIGTIKTHESTRKLARRLEAGTARITTARRDAGPGPFLATVVGLGALGVVTRMTLGTVPAFSVRQYVYEGLPYEQVAEHFGAIMASAYSVSLFTDWRSSRIRQAWLKRRADAVESPEPEPRWLGGRLAHGPRNPVPGMPPRVLHRAARAARALARTPAALPPRVHPQLRR